MLHYIVVSATQMLPSKAGSFIHRCWSFSARGPISKTHGKRRLRRQPIKA